MKKILAVVIAAMMLMSLAACGVKDKVDTAVKDAVEDAVNDVVQDVAEVANKEITRGVIAGDVYTSEFSGVTFTKPSDWTYSTDAELAELMNTSVENINASDLAKAVSELGTVYDMMVTDAYTGTNVIVAYENLAITNAGKLLDEKEYLDLLKNNLTTQTSMNYAFSNGESVMLSGDTYLKATFTVDVNGVTVTQVYYLRDIDGIMNTIIVTAVNGYTDADIEAMFS